MTNPQITGNVGLYYACYMLSRRHWNVMPTARNARGIDIVAYEAELHRYLGLQVKTLSRRAAVPLGSSLDKIGGDFWIIVTKAAKEDPVSYILRPEEVRHGATRNERAGVISFWLDPPAYDRKDYRERWDRISTGGDRSDGG